MSDPRLAIWFKAVASCLTERGNIDAKVLGYWPTRETATQRAQEKSADIERGPGGYVGKVLRVDITADLVVIVELDGRTAAHPVMLGPPIDLTTAEHGIPAARPEGDDQEAR